MPRKALTITTLFLPLSVMVSCNMPPPSTIKPLEQVLGEHWTCYTAPDSFKKAGVVVEITSDDKYVHFMNFSNDAQEGRSAIGNLHYSVDFTLLGLANFLHKFAQLRQSENLNVSTETVRTTKVSYNDTRKYVIDAAALEKIVQHVSDAHLHPTSQYAVIRESHGAKSMSIHIDDANLLSLGVDAIIDDDIGAALEVKRDVEGEYELKQEFEDYLGICTLATDLQVRRGFDGETEVTLGNTLQFPRDVVVEER